MFCPEEGLLATGDLFVSRMRPPYVKSATVGRLPTWIGTLNRVLGSTQPVRLAIPGHGDLLSGEELLEVLEFLVSERDRTEGKTPAFSLVEKALEESGPDEALSLLEALMEREDLFLMEADLVGMGYGFLNREGEPAKAVRTFRALTRLFPDSWNAWDCLGEASVEAGDRDLAVRSYRRSLELNPDNDHAMSALRALR